MSVTELQEECLVALPMRYETDPSSDAMALAFNSAIVSLAESMVNVAVVPQTAVAVAVAFAFANTVVVSIDVHDLLG